MVAQLPVASAAALLLGASVAQAQQARVVQLPDTLGANFALADSIRTGTAADYDFLVGNWQFTYQARRPDGSYNEPVTGHWSTTKKWVIDEVIMVEDHWRPDDSTSAGASGVYTWRSFNPMRARWEIQGINTWDVNWEPGLSWSDGSNRYLIQHRRAFITRIRYFGITGNAFRWRADRSTDGGRTWQLDAAVMQAQRVGQ